MSNLRIYSICHKEFRDNTVSFLEDQEIEKICGYVVNEKYPKDPQRFTKKINYLNEYDLLNYNPIFQKSKYFEYSIIPHISLNPGIFQDISHIGMLHSDIIYNKNSVNKITELLESNPDQILYHIWFSGLKNRDGGPLYFSNEQLNHICNYLSIKLKIFINPLKILTEGWIGSMAIAPMWVFSKFGKFILDNHDDFEDIINNNRWGIQDWGHRKKHTVCGLVERFWGFYLVSLNLQLFNGIDIIHVREDFTHDYT